MATAPLTRVISGLIGVHDLDDPALLGLAAANLRVGRPVVLVAPFNTERARPSAWAHTAQRLATEPALIWLHLPPARLRPAPRFRPGSGPRLSAPSGPSQPTGTSAAPMATATM